MALTINTNVSALTAQRNLAKSNMGAATSLSKLSSGSRVPTAKEDAASLSIGTGLKLDVAAFSAAQTNAQQATSMLQIADGAFGQIGDILARMKTLATTAQSDQLSTTERNFLQTEFGELEGEINRIAAVTEFNGVSLLSTSSGLEVTGAGTNLVGANGIVGFEFDDTIVTPATPGPADNFEFAFDSDTGSVGDKATLIVRNIDTSVTQSIQLDIVDIDGGGTAGIVAAGTTVDVNFDELGVTIKLNDQFGAATTTYDATAATQVNLVLDGTNTATEGFSYADAVGAAAPATTLNFQVGIGATTNDEISYSIQGGTVSDLNGGAGFAGVATSGAADTTTAQIDTAVAAVNTARATIGATLNRLEFASSNLAVSIENSEAARSTLMDVDVSAEITKFTSQQVLVQAGVSLLAQANQQPGQLLRLLQ